MDKPETDGIEPLMTPGEVAALFQVKTRAVADWAEAGKLSCIRTLGGHRRYLKREVDELLQFGDPNW